jgi:hypothetical protein
MPFAPTVHGRVITSAARGLGRGDLAVLAAALVGLGSLWARHGARNAFQPGVPALFVAGVALVATAGALCLLAVGRSASAPRPTICALAIAVPVLLTPAPFLPRPLVVLSGLALAATPLLRDRGRAAWLPVVLGSAIAAGGVITSWVWGYSDEDVFAEVQGATLALLHGHDPYSPVFTIYLDSTFQHVRHGVASFNYGPAVVLLSLPARALGDARLSFAALNISILAALLCWVRRARPGENLAPTVTALWAGSVFLPLMILHAWTDTVSLAGMAWWLVLRDRHRNWAIACLAMTVAGKPTVLPLLVPMVYWMRSIWRELVWAAIGALIVVAPFAIWTGVPQFVYDTVSIFGDLPTRHDAVTVDGVATVLGQGLVSPALLLVATLATVALFTLRRPRDYGDLLVAGCGLLIVVCLFAKQAFLNYDYNAGIALLFVAAAGSAHPSTPLRDPLGGLFRVAAARRGRRTTGAGG